MTSKFKKLVALSFSQAVKTYESAAVLHQYVGNAMMDKLHLFTLQPKRILDAGANTGLFTKALKKRYPSAQLVAFDISPQMLKATRKKFSLWRKPALICGDVDELPFEDNSFDLIFSDLMLPWCLDRKTTFRELQRILTKDGILIFSTYGIDTLIEVRQAWASIDDMPHTMPFVDMHNLGDELMQAGFNHPVMETEQCLFLYKDVMSLIQELRALGAQNQHPMRRKSLQGKNAWKKFIENYQCFAHPDKKIPAHFEIIYGHAFGTNQSLNPSAGTQSHETLIPITRLRETV